MHQAYRDLTNQLGKISLLTVAKEVQALADRAKRLYILTDSMVEAYKTAMDADKAGDEKQKDQNRGLLQQALSQFAEGVAALDMALQKQTTSWRLKPQLNRPLPEPVLAQASESNKPTIRPVSLNGAGGSAIQLAEAKSTDLLAEVRLPLDVVSGNWRRTPHGIEVAEAGWAKLALPYDPESEYDFRIVFTPRDADTHVVQILRHADKTFAWHLGGKSEKKGYVGGFAKLNDHPAGDNRSTVNLKSGLTAGKQYTMVVKVRNHWVGAYLDGMLVTDLKTNYKELSLARGWTVGPGCLGIATSSPTVVHSAEVIAGSADSNDEAFPAPSEKEKSGPSKEKGRRQPRR